MPEYMKTGDAPIVSPSKNDLALVTQNGKTRNTKIGDIGDLLLGTENLGNTKSIKQNIIDNTTQLKDKVNKSSVINNCSTTEEGFVADARQLKFLNDKFSNYLTHKENINIDSETGSWYCEALNAHNSNHNTYPFDNFGGVILQIDTGYFRFQIAVSGWGTVGTFIRSINAGLEFTNTEGHDNTNWKEINFK